MPTRRNKRRDPLSFSTAPTIGDEIVSTLEGFGYSRDVEPLDPNDKEGLMIGFLDTKGQNVAAVSPRGTRQKVPISGGGANLGSLANIGTNLALAQARTRSAAVAGGGGTAGGGGANAGGDGQSAGAGPIGPPNLAAWQGQHPLPGEPQAAALAQALSTPGLPGSEDLRQTSLPPERQGFLDRALEFIGSPQFSDIAGRLAQAISGPFQNSWQAQVGALASQLASAERTDNYFKRLRAGEEPGQIEGADVAGITPEERATAIQQHMAFNRDYEARQRLELDQQRAEDLHKKSIQDYTRGDIELRVLPEKLNADLRTARLALGKAEFEERMRNKYGERFEKARVEAEEEKLGYYEAQAKAANALASQRNENRTSDNEQDRILNISRVGALLQRNSQRMRDLTSDRRDLTLEATDVRRMISIYSDKGDQAMVDSYTAELESIKEQQTKLDELLTGLQENDVFYNQELDKLESPGGTSRQPAAGNEGGDNTAGTETGGGAATGGGEAATTEGGTTTPPPATSRATQPDSLAAPKPTSIRETLGALEDVVAAGEGGNRSEPAVRIRGILRALDAGADPEKLAPSVTEMLNLLEDKNVGLTPDEAAMFTTFFNLDAPIPVDEDLLVDPNRVLHRRLGL